MIRIIIEETMAKMSRKLFSLGLPNYCLKEAAWLAGTTVLLAFMDKMATSRAHQLINLLNGGCSPGQIAFIQNFIQDLSIRFLKKNLIDDYKANLINKLQINSSAASAVSQTVIPEIMKSMLEIFSNINVDEQSLAKIIDEGLPLSTSMNVKLAPR
jgi:hypothetical protein